MATNVCVCEENLEVLEGGRLCVKHDCSLVDGDNGLELPVMQVFDNQSESNNDNVVMDGTGTQISETVEITVTNPSTCRSMRVQVIEQSYTVLYVLATDEIRVQHRRVINGGAAATSSIFVEGPNDSAGYHGGRHEVTYYVTLAPGAALNILLNVRGTLSAGGGGSYKTESALTLSAWGILI